MSSIKKIFKKLESYGFVKDSKEAKDMFIKELQRELLVSKKVIIDNVGTLYIREAYTKSNHYDPRTNTKMTVTISPKLRVRSAKAFNSLLKKAEDE